MRERNMPKLIAFEQVSLDGFFVDGKGDMSWAHRQDAEWNAFTRSNASGDGALLFGRVTYAMRLKRDLAAEVRKRKQEPGPDMAILGSGSIVSQLAQAGLIDEFQIVVNPIALGQGRTLFGGGQ